MGTSPERPRLQTASRRDSRVIVPAVWGEAALAWVCQMIFWQSALSESSIGAQFLSLPTWRALVTRLGGRVLPLDGQLRDGQLLADPGPPLIWTALFSLVAASLLLAAVSLANHFGRAHTEQDEPRGDRSSGWRWWWLLGLWELARLIADLSGWSALGVVLLSTANLVQIIAWAGFVATRLRCDRAPLTVTAERRRFPLAVWAAAGLYAVTFTTLNWRLWDNLLIPHGDSAMYEEHLWNLLHGKGFRSYLDGGRLFLGEHVQLIHLGLIPAYLVWPSHRLLELAQSLALAATVFPAYRLALRHGGSSRAATLFAVATACYLPLQFLDIAIDFKTFRPNAFEIPFLLFGLDALERGRLRVFCVWAVLMLLCQEDAAPILAPLGVWIAIAGAGLPECWLTRRWPALGRPALPVSSSPVSAMTESNRPVPSAGLWRGFGLLLAGGATLYLVLVLKVILPWFRGGADVHFAQYFSDLGASTGEIVVTVLTQPWRLLAKWMTPDVALFGLLLVVPLGLLPLAAPGRLAVALPLFLILALNQLSRSPVHHFHAPLVPILIWAAAAGLGTWSRMVFGMTFWPSGGADSVRREQMEAERRQKIESRRFPKEAIKPRADRVLPRVDSAAEEQPSANDVRTAEDAGAHPTDTGGALRGARFALGCSLGLMLLSGFTPLGIPFWDAGSRAYWRTLYVTSDRARAAEAVVAAIPPLARVASTDFIHPRFTHHARSYDYSDYRPDIPPDADFLVIDTGHPYSTIKRPDEVKEYRRVPREWELLPVETQGYFLVFQRIAKPPSPDASGAGQ
jgi:uncharacterized membrane protein